jgi:hypothetical protein
MSAITLTHPTAGAGNTPLALTLPRELLWQDEYGWSPVLSQRQHTGTGALVIDTWTRQAGRPITLQAEQTRAWCERGALETLRQWCAQPGVVFALNYLGRAFQVAFDTAAGQSPISAEPIAEALGAASDYTVRDASGQLVTDVSLDYFDPAPTDPFVVTLRFIQL